MGAKRSKLQQSLTKLPGFKSKKAIVLIGLTVVVGSLFVFDTFAAKNHPARRGAVRATRTVNRNVNRTVKQAKRNVNRTVKRATRNVIRIPKAVTRNVINAAKRVANVIPGVKIGGGGGGGGGGKRNVKSNGGKKNKCKKNCGAEVTCTDDEEVDDSGDCVPIDDGPVCLDDEEVDDSGDCVPIDPGAICLDDEELDDSGDCVPVDPGANCLEDEILDENGDCVVVDLGGGGGDGEGGDCAEDEELDDNGICVPIDAGGGGGIDEECGASEEVDVNGDCIPTDIGEGEGGTTGTVPNVYVIINVLGVQGDKGKCSLTRINSNQNATLGGLTISQRLPDVSGVSVTPFHMELSCKAKGSKAKVKLAVGKGSTAQYESVSAYRYDRPTKRWTLADTADIAETDDGADMDLPSPTGDDLYLLAAAKKNNLDPKPLIIVLLSLAAFIGIASWAVKRNLNSN